MCLLGIVPKKADRQEITTAWLRDVYERNSDGFGFAWSTPSGGVHVFKSIGKFREFKRAWREMERHSGEFAFHLRMKTHGAITKEMAHPYPIGDTGMHLMHNGVLACGNSADRTKSDTWHYINDIVLPLYNKIGENIFDELLLDMMGDAIGNNRFVIVDKQGNLHVVNRHQGVNWNGMWLSNTYAWSASKFGYYSGRGRALTGTTTTQGGKVKQGTVFDDDDNEGFDWSDWRRWQGQGSYTPLNTDKTRDYSTPGRSLAGPTQVKQGEAIGSLVDTKGNVLRGDAKNDGEDNISFDFIQLLYTLGYTQAANELSMGDVDDYVSTFGELALEAYAAEVAEFQLDDDEIIAEIKMDEDGNTGEEPDDDERVVNMFEGRGALQLEDIGDRAAMAAERALASTQL